MPVLTLVLVMLATACGTCLILAGVRRLGTPRELRGDWWSEFEREFRAYAARCSADKRDRARRRHRGEPA